MKKFLFLVLFIVIISSPCFACVGARALSMGGAFTGCADDESAVYWNPAGLVFIESRGVSYTPTLNNRDRINYDDFISYTVPDTGKGAGGLSFINTGFDLLYEEGMKLTERWYVYSYGRKVGDNLALGINLRYQRTKIERIGLGTIVDRGYSYDLSALYKREFFSFGVLIQDVPEPKIAIFQHVKNVRPGFSIRPTDRILLTFEYYDLLENAGDEFPFETRWRAGFEGKISEHLSIRAGLYHNIPTYGIGYRNGPWQFNYTFLGEELGRTSMIEITMRY